MTLPTYTSTEASPRERGYAFGSVHREAVTNSVRAYRRLFAAARGLGTADIRAAGAAFGETLAEGWPDLRDEIAGLAAGASADEHEILALNARTEILAGFSPPECSVIAVLPGRTPSRSTLLAQNWDWHPDLTSSRVLWTVVEPGGRWFTTLTEAGILAKIGLNSRRLGVCLNLLASSADGGVGGVPIHILLRLLLERCGNLTDALQLLLNAKTSASSCFNIAYADDGGGTAVALELSPVGANLAWPTADGWLAHTNHFRTPPSPARDIYGERWPDTYIRLHEVERRLREYAHEIGVADLQHLLRSHFNSPLAICCHDDNNQAYAERQATLASVVIDLGQLRFFVSDGAPCESAYREIAHATQLMPTPESADDRESDGRGSSAGHGKIRGLAARVRKS